MSDVLEVLSGVGQRDYYLKKIDALKQDIHDIESGIISSYGRKTECVKALIRCYEELGDIPKNEIARKVISDLVQMGCKRGIKWTYQLIDNQYKRDYKRDLSGVDNDEEGEDRANVWNQTLQQNTFLELPHPEDVSKHNMSPDDLRENQEHLAKLGREIKRREQEYIEVMDSKHIAREDQKEADIESTPRPYDVVHGHFYESMVNLSEFAAKLSKTCKDISEKIEYYPPENEAEDSKLAEGVDAWITLVEWFNEHLRPYADLKFSQDYVHWWKTQALNRDFGKHAAAVKSKIATLSGTFRGLTREQVGDKGLDLVEKAMHFKGLLEIANKAFSYLQNDMPGYHNRRVAPSVATRKENVSPKLSESAFGSSKDR